MISRTVKIFLAFLSCFGLTIFSSNVVADGFEKEDYIVAVLDKEPITENDLESRIKLISIIRKIDPSKVDRAAALDDLITERIKLSALASTKVVPQEARVQKVQDTVFKNTGATKGVEDLFFESKGINFQSVGIYAYVEAGWPELVYKIYGPDILPTKFEIKEALETELRNLQKSNEWDMGVIFISKENKNAIQLSRQIASIINTQNFETLAMKYSSDSTSAPTGGRLGWSTPNDPTTILHLETLQPGEVSSPIDREDSVVFIKVYGKRQGRPPVKIEWSSITFPIGKGQKVMSYLRKNIRGNCQGLDKLSKNMQVDFYIEDLRSIDEYTASAIENLRPGQASPIMEYSPDTGKIFVVCKKIFPERFIAQVKTQLTMQKELIYSKKLYQIFLARAPLSMYLDLKK